MDTKLNPVRDFFIFLGVMFILFVIWLVTGGPARQISQSGTYLNPPVPLGNGQGYNDSSVGLNIPNLGPIPGVSTQSGTTQRAASGGTTAVANANAANAEYLLITIPAGSPPVQLSGLTLADNTGNRATIPYGTQQFVAGGVSPQEAITLFGGERAYISSGRSPVGTSFKVNACSGYLEQFQSFTPTLSNSCPLIANEVPGSLSGSACSNYLATIGSCQTPLDLSLAKQYGGDACTAFITAHANYNGCVAFHKNEPVFRKPEWRIYLNQTGPLWTSSKTINLLDTQGRILLTLTPTKK
jgi:hypothetical protein